LDFFAKELSEAAHVLAVLVVLLLDVEVVIAVYHPHLQQ
jgi:hypothetical protein